MKNNKISTEKLTLTFELSNTGIKNIARLLTQLDAMLTKYPKLNANTFVKEIFSKLISIDN